MFGYILPEKPELKAREYELFRAFYCGVCKSIGNRYGFAPRLTLTYDSAFLAILLSSLVDDNLDIKNERCIVHPLAKRKIIKGNALVDYASDMNIILAYYNLADNWQDEHSILSAAGLTLLRGAHKKVKAKYGKKCDIIKGKLEELAILEKNKCSSMDAASEPFAKLMEEVTAYEPLCINEKNEKILRWIGYNIGKWIYILDSYDDIESDIKNRSYNPLVYQYEFENKNNVAGFKAQIKDRVEFNLTYSLNQIAKAYELLDTKSDTGILENIVYMGMLRKTDQILGTGSCGKIEKSI